MRLWFIHGWAYVCFVGLMLTVLALQGLNTKASAQVVVVRILSALCGLATIAFGIWMNLR